MTSGMGATERPLRIATWNVNSIRTRIERVQAFLKVQNVDVLALQETKCATDKFPAEPFAADGYEVAAWGTGQWNGVAILSRVGIEDVERGFPGQPGFGEGGASDDGDRKNAGDQLEPRAIGATCAGVRIWSCYVPNGRAVGVPHYEYKLRWLQAISSYAGQLHAADPKAPVAFVGDWNVIPLDADAWDPAQVSADGVYLTPAERDALKLMQSAGYEEVSRRFIPAEHTYTFWDYRQLRFPRNEGMRIDFAFCSPALAARVTGVLIDRDERKGHKPSDHVPVIVDVRPANGTR